MEQLNIMVFPCGSEIGLELHRALKDIRFITLFGASSVSDHGKSVYENYIGGIPYISDPAFLDAINSVIDKYKINFIFPALDSVISALSRIRDSLHAELLTSPDEAVQICRSKDKTYKRLEGCSFLPGVYSSPEDVPGYPVIIKPAEGQGAQGFMIIKSKEELVYELSQRSDPQVICEYLPGEEYTIDCFTDRNGKLRFASCRNRNRIKNGISVNSSLMPPDKRIREIAEVINGKMELRGVWFFQLKKNSAGEYRLLECATRVAGTMCLERAAGVNLALLTVFDALGYDVQIPEILPSASVDRALYNVFSLDIDYDEAYIDYDDTLIVKGKVNFSVLRFIYQCVERKIRVVLLTRHETDVREDMKVFRIFPELFDDIICIPRSEKKTDHIMPSKKAVFIDDSYAERESMKNAFGILTFGVDSVEALIDERQ
ncbi:MAG: ATP-grasp domain-containing protein [Oscillospiraceae bacterium]|nr:ATP-grasp domain-containing protein [Oscillospiraceae bacterium]